MAGDGAGSWKQPAANELHISARRSSNAKELTDVALYHHVLDLLTAINDNRNERLDSADGTVPSALWLVLIAGAVITLGYPSFFGSSNITAQVLMTAALAALVALDRLRGGRARLSVHR